MYVRLQIYLCIYIYIHICYIHNICVCIHTYSNVNKRIYLHQLMFVNIRTYINIHIYVHLPPGLVHMCPPSLPAENQIGMNYFRVRVRVRLGLESGFAHIERHDYRYII
jgi:hypothetical protein